MTYMLLVKLRVFIEEVFKWKNDVIPNSRFRKIFIESFF